MIYCEDCSSYDCGCPERKETESLRQQLVSSDAEIARLKGMVDEIQAARKVNSDHDKLLTQIASRDVEIAPLREQVALLRDALLYERSLYLEAGSDMEEQGLEALAATEQP